MAADENEFSAEGFGELIRRIRCGDAEAAATLIRMYESDLRIIARSRLTNPEVRRILDSMDVCQSVLGTFFARATVGQFSLDTPEQLLKLLSTMVRNKVIDYARRQAVKQRHIGRQVDVFPESLSLAATQDTPSVIVAARELAEDLRRRFTGEELAIIDRRNDGLGWDDVSLQLHESPEALRKKMERAIRRVAQEAGPGVFDDD